MLECRKHDDLSKWTVGTRRRIRTDTYGGLNSRPLPIGLDGHYWDLHSSDKGADAQVVMQTLAADHVA
jgi:hypothetical protein